MEDQIPPSEKNLQLFRKEAIDTVTNRLGTPIRPASISGWMITALLVVILLASSFFLTNAQYARKESVVGVLVPSAGALKIVAPKAGVISAVRVADGQLIQAGAPILTINLDPTTNGGAPLSKLLLAATDSQVRALRAQLEAHRLSIRRQQEELHAKRSGLVSRLDRLKEDIELQERRLQLQQDSLESFRILNEKKIVSDLQYRDRIDSVLQVNAAISAIKKDREETSSSIAQTDAELLRLEADLRDSEAQIDNSGAQLQEKRASNSVEGEIVLTAPKTGRIVALQMKSGAAVASSQSLAIILPDGAKLEAQLWAPSKSAGFVKKGNKVRLLFDAFPFQQFGVGVGRVVNVANSPTAPNELPIPLETKESLYRIDVALERQDIDGYGKIWPLVPGMRLTADLILNDRSLFEWLFDPLIAASRRNGYL